MARPKLVRPGSLDDRWNTEISHEQLFFEDFQSPANLGFFDDGTLHEETNPTGYRCRSGHYNDCIMRKAVENVPLRSYCLLGRVGFGRIPSLEKFNCQDWTADVRREYGRLARDPAIVRECECKR